MHRHMAAMPAVGVGPLALVLGTASYAAPRWLTLANSTHCDPLPSMPRQCSFRSRQALAVLGLGCAPRHPTGTQPSHRLQHHPATRRRRSLGLVYPAPTAALGLDLNGQGSLCLAFAGPCCTCACTCRFQFACCSYVWYSRLIASSLGCTAMSGIGSEWQRG